MAKQEQLRLLRSDMTEWNTWREKYPNEEIDLSRAAKLQGANLGANAQREAYRTRRTRDVMIGQLLKLSYRVPLGFLLGEKYMMPFIISDAVKYNDKIRVGEAALHGADLHQVDLHGVDLDEADP